MSNAAMNSMLHVKKWSDAESRKALTATQIIAKLSHLTDWRLRGGDSNDDALAIEKTYTFANYFETMAFVNALAFVAHAQDHHPELTVSYNRCVVRLNTHDVNGISQTDMDCAAKFDGLLKDAV